MSPMPKVAVQCDASAPPTPTRPRYQSPKYVPATAAVLTLTIGNADPAQPCRHPPLLAIEKKCLPKSISSQQKRPIDNEYTIATSHRVLESISVWMATIPMRKTSVCKPLRHLRHRPYGLLSQTARRRKPLPQHALWQQRERPGDQARSYIEPLHQLLVGHEIAPRQIDERHGQRAERHGNQ